MFKDGEISFFGMASRQLHKAEDFFGNLFGWSVVPAPKGYSARLEGAGLRAFAHPTDQIPGFFVYFKVSDIEAAAEKVKSLGGKTYMIIDDPLDGRFLNCEDDQGMRFGLHQPKK